MRAVTGDEVGVFLNGVLASSLGGADEEGVVAQKNDELIAIKAAERGKGSKE